MTNLSGQFARLLRAPDRSFLLTGEDREFGGDNLFVDLIPSTCWFSNVRTCIRPRDWTVLRKKIYARAGNKCECCGFDPSEFGRSLEAHERWMYNSRTGVQKLMRIIALCKMCHTATHMSLADTLGMGERARTHLMRVRNIDTSEMKEHCKLAMSLWDKRSRRNWKLDLSIITDSGIELRRHANRRDVSGHRAPVQSSSRRGPRKVEQTVSESDSNNSDSSNSANRGTALRISSDKHASATLVGLRRRYGSATQYKIELTINRKIPGSSAKWWLRPVNSRGDLGHSDRRLPYIPAIRRFHVRCTLTEGRYVVGCGSSLSGISQEFTVDAGGNVTFTD